MTFLESGPDLCKPVYARSGKEIPQPKAWKVEAEQRTQSLVRLRTEVLVDDLGKKGKSRLKIRSTSSYMYNCVGMIFANRRTWIDIEHIYAILKEDGYKEISDQKLDAGDIVLYTDANKPSHVGIITCVYPSIGQILNTRVLSKWGRDGEVEHHLDDVPAFCGKPTSFWSEKVL